MKRKKCYIACNFLLIAFLMSFGFVLLVIYELIKGALL